MINRTVILGFIGVFLIGTVSASSFGTYVSDKDRHIDDYTTTFDIKAMNLGTQTLEIQITSEYIDDADTRHDDTLTISPSIVTRNPGQYEPEEGQEWFLLDDERYVLVDKIPVTFVADQVRDRNSFDFTVDLAARTVSDTEDADDDKVVPSQEVVQERGYSFSVTTSASSTDIGSETGETSSETEDSSFGLPGLDYSETADSVKNRSMEIFATNEEEDTTDEEDSEITRDWDSEEESQETTDTGQDEESGDSITGEFTAAVSGSYTTLALLLGTLISFGYLMRVAI